MADENTPGPAERSPFIRPGFIASAVLIALVAIGGVLVVALPDDKSPPVVHPTAAPPTWVDPTANSKPSPTVLPTAVPTVAPAGVEWKLLGQVALPYSATAGPHQVTATTATGFEHSPVGALIAAPQISTRAALSAGAASYEPTVTKQFVPSPDRDKLLAGLRSAPQVGAEPGELSQLAGYQFLSYTPDTAVIGLVDRAPGQRDDPRYYVTTVTLLWQDGDWRMVAPPGGLWTSISRPALDLTGVVEWGAR